MSNSPGEGPAELRPADVARDQVRSFALIVAIFIVLLLISLAASWAAIDVVNGTRSYATGEGRYSKAQKIAVLNLYRYAYSGRAGDYQAFVEATAIPIGDRIARLALEQSPPDISAAAAGFLQGDNHPDDIGGIIRLFRWFGWWEPFAAAVEDWREGDRLVAELVEHGARLAEQVASGRIDEQSRLALLAAIDRTDRRLTELENTFSTHMGEAARASTRLVIVGLGATTVLLWLVGMVFASRLFRHQLALDRALASSQQRFRDYAEVASDWYWETDADLRIIYVSERFPVVTGVPAESALGHSAVDFIREHYSDGPGQEEPLAALAAHRPFRGLRLRHRRADGALGVWSLAGKPRFDTGGAFLGFRGVGSDITASVVDAERLVEAKLRAEEANRAKSEFLANMSHELRTPLNAVLGFSEVIAKRLFGADAADRYVAYADNIHRSGSLLLSIIDDVLDLSKIEAGRAELTETEIGLDELFEAVRSLLGERFEGSGLALEIQTPAPPPRLRVDARKLKQCLVNLLSNALKFTPAGGRVTLGAAADQDGLSITVSDTGIGIAPEDMATVLAPFGQIESAFSRRHSGTGLGLSLVRSLIELHGGSFRLESVPGAGTVVTLSLPPKRVVAMPAPARLATGSA